MPDYAERLCSLFEARLPFATEGDGREDDWNVIGPAMLAGAARHLRTIVHLQKRFPSAVIGWQLVRSMFEYVATYSWIAADPTTRAEQWLKSDYVQRLKLDNDFRELGEGFLTEEVRRLVADFRPEADEMPGSLVDRTKQADEAWADQVRELAAFCRRRTGASGRSTHSSTGTGAGSHTRARTPSTLSSSAQSHASLLIRRSRLSVTSRSSAPASSRLASPSLSPAHPHSA